MSLLASSPQLSQAIRQQVGAQAGIYGGGAGFNPLGMGQQQQLGQQGQAGDFNTAVQHIAGAVAQRLPGVIMSVFASSPQLWGAGGAGSTAIH
jgi:hypothetical protein